MDLCFGSVLHPDESFRIQGDEVGVGRVGGGKCLKMNKTREEPSVRGQKISLF